MLFVSLALMLGNQFQLSSWSFVFTCLDFFWTEEYTEADFASRASGRGGKRVTRYADHCPVCSLDLRRIIVAAKEADGNETDATAASSSGGTGGTNEACCQSYEFLIYV